MVRIKKGWALINPQDDRLGVASGWHCFPARVWVPASEGPLMVFASRHAAEASRDTWADSRYVAVPCLWIPWGKRLPRHSKGVLALWIEGDEDVGLTPRDLPRGARLARAVYCLE